MSNQTKFLIERVAQEEALAKAAQLDNVRDNHLRAADAWKRLAERSVRGDTLRDEETKRKAERDELAAQESAERMLNALD